MKKIVLFLGVVAVTLFGREIQPITEELAPYQIKNGKDLSGISVDIVREIQKRIGNHKKILVLPWNRAYIMTQKKPYFALFSTLKTDERAPLFKWVGPLVHIKVKMFKNKNNKHIYKTLEDAKKVDSIAVVKNDALAQYLEAKGFTNLKIQIARSSKTNIERVANGDAELFPMNETSANYRIKQLGLKDKIVVTQIPPFLEKDLYIAFNKETPNSVIKKWQTALDEIKKDGTYQRILNNYK